MWDFIDFGSLHLWLIFGSAFSMSLAHCGGMCGAIAIAYSSIKTNPTNRIDFAKSAKSMESASVQNPQNPQNPQNYQDAINAQNPQKSQNAQNHQSHQKHLQNPKIFSLQMILGHIAYSLGRLFSYVCVGIVFAFLGEGFALSLFFRSFGEFFIGILLVGYAICFAFFPKILRLVEPNLAKAGIFGRAFGALIFSPRLRSFFALGVLNGFLPCGLVYFFALNALNAGLVGTQAIFSSILIMVVFWAGTLPIMLGIGFVGSTIKSYQQIFLKISFLLMLSVGLLTIYKGFITISKIF